MKGLAKTLIGDKRNAAVTACCVIAAFAILHSPLAFFAGAVLPAGLLAGAAYLAKH